MDFFYAATPKKKKKCYSIRLKKTNKKNSLRIYSHTEIVKTRSALHVNKVDSLISVYRAG